MVSDKVWDSVAWAHAGSQRRVVLCVLDATPMTPERLRQAVNDREDVHPKLSLREISRHVTAFDGKRLAECLNPDAPYNKLYRLTALGMRVKKELLKMK